MSDVARILGERTDGVVGHDTAPNVYISQGVGNFFSAGIFTFSLPVKAQDRLGYNMRTCPYPRYLFAGAVRGFLIQMWLLFAVKHARLLRDIAHIWSL